MYTLHTNLQAKVRPAHCWQCGGVGRVGGGGWEMGSSHLER